MRLATRALRDVKPKLSILHPRYHLRPTSHQLYIRAARDIITLSGLTVRAISTSAAHLPTNLPGSFLEPAAESASQASTGHPHPAPGPEPEPITSLVQNTHLFGKWTALLTDHSRLAVESDFFRRGPAQSWASRLLVDKLENHGDFALWTCLLDFQMRINGDEGVLNVWRGLWGRKSLYETDHPLAPTFFRLVLEAAVKSSDDGFLESIWVYSEWMLEIHGTKWPRLYPTVLEHFLQTRQPRRTLQWQLRLTPNFYPGAKSFANMVKRFVTDKHPDSTSTLQSLYFANRDHNLYDLLVPYLYGLGESRLAKQWRRACSIQFDIPLSPVASRPFLRFLKGYHPEIDLLPAEENAMSGPEADTEDVEPVELSREFINRVHGKTFGISVKNYNDRLGARWFASSWVPLDSAITAVSTLGVGKIGPLSLQSIALREGTPQGVLSRIAQLQEHGITVVESAYTRMMIYLAKKDDQELLMDLLQSDLHPEVFDDLNLQSRLLGSMLGSSEWKNHRLLLVASSIVLEQARREIANTLVSNYFRQRDTQGLLRVLDDMKTTNVELDYEQAYAIFESIQEEAAERRGPNRTRLIPQAWAFYLSVFRKLSTMDIPVPVTCWRIVLFSLIRQGQLGQVESLCFELLELFTSTISLRPGFVPVHPDDVPATMREPLAGVDNLLGVYVPQDLPTDNPQHPLRLLFDKKLLSTLMRYSFSTALDRQAVARADLAQPLYHSHEPRAFGVAQAVRLLRLLHDRGLAVQPPTVARHVKDRLTMLYGPYVLTKRSEQRLRARNHLKLSEMKALVDEAWGAELLPALPELRTLVLRQSRTKAKANWEYLNARIPYHHAAGNEFTGRVM
ncbi:hypothetical protein F4780DRAFT_664208 [Xylariomycetidae sp. FL0641]|nr:hypothetical protein F4780DRAFT_664208 [Xylariomycetidae sp. FL0641]